MGAVSLGYSGYDGIAAWNDAHPGPGPDYFARLTEARELVHSIWPAPTPPARPWAADDIPF
jgi:hypothetical protein